MTQDIIIDAHTHAFLPKDLAALKKTAVILDEHEPEDSPYNWTPRFDSTVESLLAIEREAGVSHFVILPVSIRPERAPEMTRWAARQAEKHPQIIAFGSIHPASKTLEDDLALIRDLGLKGVKLHSLVQQFNPLSDEALRAYAAIERAGLVVLMDCMHLDGAEAAKPNLKPLLDISRERKVETGPAQLREIARRFSGLKIIAAHLGFLYGWDRLEPLYHLDNIYLDLAYVHRLLGPGEIMPIIRHKGTDRIIFGSDAPYRRPKNALEWFMALPLSEKEKADILAGNLLGLLGGLN